jgi:hypothetical protein
MGIRMERFPEHGVTLVIYSGEISTEDVLTHFTQLDPADLVRRINVLDPTLDYRVGVAAIPKLKGIIAAKLHELDNGERAAAAFVSSSGSTELVHSFWPTYLGTDFPGTRAGFASLEQAYDWLGLADDARKAVTAAVRSHVTEH